MRAIFFCGLLGVAAALCADEPAARREVQLNGHTFTLPVGFEIELVAGPDLVPRPITADFDERGRLYVADSSGSNDPVQKQLDAKPHRIVRLEDVDGDGKFDKQTVFADRMMFPEGTMWLNGSLYVAAPPSIWKLTDANDDGVADEREEWLQGKTLTGCANDLHGPYRGPDGWIYWCKGAFAEQTYDIRGKPWKTKASHIFRARPDGTGLEPVMTGGIDNPVAVVFTAGGERIFSATFLHQPAGGKRDGLGHALYGAVFGKDHAPVHEHPRGSVALATPLVELGPAAPCGLALLESDALGTEYRGNLFAAQFNLRKVSRHALTPRGVSFATRDEDFLVSDHVDFHPTDVIEDADGSLLVVDTGGWYKLCCPTAQFPRPEVLGGIYRVSRKQAIRDPRGLQLDWDSPTTAMLAERLADARPAVRRRALEALARREEAELQPLFAAAENRPPLATLNLVWLTARRDFAAAATWRRAALSHADADVRRAAFHVTALLHDADSLPALQTALRSPHVADRCGAAEALGRLGAREATAALLTALSRTEDAAETAALTYALIEIGDPMSTRPDLTSSVSRVRQAFLFAREQMPDGGLSSEEVRAGLTSADPDLAATAWWIAERHPKWAESLREVYRRPLYERTADQDRWIARLSRGAKQGAIQNLLGEAALDARANRALAFAAMARAGLKETPAGWLVAVEATLEGNTPVTLNALAAYRAFPEARNPVPKVLASLERLVGNVATDPELRLRALAALPADLAAPKDATWEFLLKSLAATEDARVRAAAVEALGRCRLDDARLISLANALPTLGPTELDRALDAFAQSTSDQVGSAVLRGLNAAQGVTLRGNDVRARLAKYGVLTQVGVDQLCLKLDAQQEQKQARLQELSKSLVGGDVKRGQALFQRSKAACSACHAIGYVGGKVGPDLTKIGAIRTELDLLESIVFPSASIARSYETTLFQTSDGRTVQGLIREETPEAFVVVTGLNQEARVVKAEIEAQRPGELSVMPSGLDQQFTPAELADLIAYLKACR